MARSEGLPRVIVKSALFRVAGFTRAKSFSGKLLSFSLRIASKFWHAGVCIDRCFTRRVRLPRPVVSVGNITVGGTGKTPFVITLGEELRNKGLKVAVLTRGYKAQSTERDEPYLIKSALPDAQVLVSANRVKAAFESLKGPFAPDIFLLDDGFQHWRLHRDVDIVLLDCLLPFGLGEVVPLGFLREPISALARANFVVLTRSDLVADWKLEGLLEYLQVRFPGLQVVLSLIHI